MKTKLTLILFVFCAALALTAAAAVGGNPELDAEWEDFKQRYGKQYDGGDGDADEEGMRREIYEDNVALIAAHNAEAERGVHSFEIGLNEFADMTDKEFFSTMNGFVMSDDGGGDRIASSPGEIYEPREPEHTPKHKDWRKEGYVTAVKNQLRCGSCWAFSATGSLEGQNFKKTGNLTSLSEQQLVDCDHKDHGCMGGAMDFAFEYIHNNSGVDTEASYPYVGKDGKMCLFKKEDVGASDTSFVNIPSKNESALKSAIAEIGPISVAIDAGHREFMLYKNGVFSSQNCSSVRLDHGVLAVGYGTQDVKNVTMDYYIVKNSWGLTWGDAGYIKMSRNNDNNCGIATQASYPVV